MAVGLTGEVTIFPDAAEKVSDTPEARAYLEQVAKAVGEEAQATAPVRTGAYRDSIGSGPLDGTRPGAQVWAGTDYWYELEYGSIHNRPFRTLTNALASASKSAEAP